MKGRMMALLAIISFLLISGRSSGRLLENNLFFDYGNPSAFDPNLNSVVDNGSQLKTADGHLDQGTVRCDEEISLWTSSPEENATNDNKLSFRLSPSVEKTKKPQLPEDSAERLAKGVFNLLPKGTVTPSGPSPNVNSMVTEQRLSVSDHSHNGVGHMQMIRPESPDAPKTHHSNVGEDHLQSNERKLGSTPSPGVGN